MSPSASQEKCNTTQTTSFKMYQLNKARTSIIYLSRYPYNNKISLCCKMIKHLCIHNISSLHITIMSPCITMRPVLDEVSQSATLAVISCEPLWASDNKLLPLHKMYVYISYGICVMYKSCHTLSLYVLYKYVADPVASTSYWLTSTVTDSKVEKCKLQSIKINSWAN